MDTIDYKDLSDQVVGLRFTGFQLSFGDVRNALRAGAQFEKDANGKLKTMFVPKVIFDETLNTSLGISTHHMIVEMDGVRQALIKPSGTYNQY